MRHWRCSYRGCPSGGCIDGISPDGFDKVSGGVWSKDLVEVAAVVLSFGAVSPFPAGDAGSGDGDPSKLPRMTGKPSLPVPMITILELEDCASCSVASIPRQRKYDGLDRKS